MWCASSISMKRVVRASGSKPDSAKRQELEFSITIGEIGEHEECQPVRRPFVEGAEDPRIVLIARAALQQGVGFLAAIATEVPMQQVHHGPQVTALFDVDLKQIAQVIERRAGESEMALLLDRGGFRVALGDDDPPQIGAMLAGNVLPGRLTLVVAEIRSCVRRPRDSRRCPSDSRAS